MPSFATVSGPPFDIETLPSVEPIPFDPTSIDTVDPLAADTVIGAEPVSVKLTLPSAPFAPAFMLCALRANGKFEGVVYANAAAKIVIDGTALPAVGIALMVCVPSVRMPPALILIELSPLVSTVLNIGPVANALAANKVIEVGGASNDPHVPVPAMVNAPVLLMMLREVSSKMLPLLVKAVESNVAVD